MSNCSRGNLSHMQTRMAEKAEFPWLSMPLRNPYSIVSHQIRRRSFLETCLGFRTAPVPGLYGQVILEEARTDPWKFEKRFTQLQSVIRSSRHLDGGSNAVELTSFYSKGDADAPPVGAIIYHMILCHLSLKEEEMKQQISRYS
jgi:hypothetical protein